MATGRRRRTRVGRPMTLNAKLNRHRTPAATGLIAYR